METMWNKGEDPAVSLLENVGTRDLMEHLLKGVITCGYFGFLYVAHKWKWRWGGWGEEEGMPKRKLPTMV